MPHSSTFKASLTSSVRRYLHPTASIRDLQPLTAGSSADTWKFDVITEQGEQPLILRRLALDENISTAVSKKTEALVQQAAVANGVIAPRVRFILEEIDQLGHGYVMDRIEGESIPQKILKQDTFSVAREHMTAQCGTLLARIHTTPLDTLPPLPNLTATAQVEELFNLYRSYEQYQPVFDVAFCWLREHIPRSVTPALVHGDFRHGNFMVDRQGICGILDWELTHIGDPMEDIGWLCVNSWRFGNPHNPIGGFGKRDEFYQTYRKQNDVEIDEAAIHFWEIFGTLKWGVICLFQCFSHLTGKIRSMERAAIGRRVSETEIDLLQLVNATGKTTSKDMSHAI
ncbi:hypothetical protein A9Q99_10760 [Gammaproteobacteria bacterium 45_16_T64]|nr:hypothetical protein A9Q99_10760 [Gammaproteobacteria bacterium 45_16_T64]